MDVHAMVQSAQFPLVQYMGVQDMKDLLDKDERIEAMVNDHELISQQKQKKEMVIVESQSMADYNLSQERRLMDERQKLLDLHKQNREARENYDRNKRQLDEVSGKYSLPVAKKMLETSATKKEEDSEEIASKFMDGEMSVSEFLDNFQLSRLDAHTTRIKADKMTEMVGNFTNYVNTAPVGLPSTPQAPPRPAPRVSAPSYVPPQVSYDKPVPTPRIANQPSGGPGMYLNAQSQPPYPPLPARDGIKYY